MPFPRIHQLDIQGHSFLYSPAKKYNSLSSQFQNVQFCTKVKDNSAGQQNWTAVRLPLVNAKILTAGILDVFRGLEFESDAEIGQKGTF